MKSLLTCVLMALLTNGCVSAKTDIKIDATKLQGEEIYEELISQPSEPATMESKKIEIHRPGISLGEVLGAAIDIHDNMENAEETIRENNQKLNESLPSAAKR